MAEEDILFGKKRHLFGGIEPSNMIKFSTIYNDGKVVIEAILPKDTIVDGQTLCTVAGAVIRRKEGDYPVDEFDGDLVMDITESGTYIDDKDAIRVPDSGGITPLSIDDTVTYYAAFPYTTQGVYNRSPINRSICISEGSYYLFGYDLDTTDPDPATRVSYPSDVMNADFTPVSCKIADRIFNYGSWNILTPGFFFMPRPCMLKNDGTVDHYLEPTDYTKLYDLSGPSKVADMSFDGNAMMEWPKIYTYREEINGVYKFRCSNVKHGPKWECWCNYDKNNNEIDHFYTSIYSTSLVEGTTVLRSISGGTRPSSLIFKDAIQYAENNGEDWTLETVADRLLINDLLVMMAKSTDTQMSFGQGRTHSGNAQAIGVNNTDGLFYGGNTGYCTKVFGMEDIWGNMPRACVGFICDGGVLKIKATRGTIDGSVVNDYNNNGSGYIELEGTNVCGTEYYIKKMVTTPFGRLPIIEDAKVVGSSSTYECDPVTFSTVLSVASFGGLSYVNANYHLGCFAVNFNGVTSANSNRHGYGLSCKPSKK